MVQKKETVSYTLHYHIVTARIELTEEERAVIVNYQLNTHVLEDRPRHTPEEVEHQREIQSQNENMTHRDPGVRQAQEEWLEDWMTKFKAERDITTVADLLKQPFKRLFGKPAQATAFSDRLKTRILPDLSILLKKHTNVPKSETLEF